MKRQMGILQTVNVLWTKKYGFGRKCLQFQAIENVETFVIPADAVEPKIYVCENVDEIKNI